MASNSKIADVVVPLHQGRLSEEGTWMEFRTCPLLLRKHRSYPCSIGVYLHDYGLVEVWMEKKRCDGEGFFQLMES